MRERLDSKSRITVKFCLKTEWNWHSYPTGIFSCTCGFGICLWCIHSQIQNPCRLKDMENRNYKLLHELQKTGADKINEAYHWLQEHRDQLKREVFGPVLLEVHMHYWAYCKITNIPLSSEDLENCFAIYIMNLWDLFYTFSPIWSPELIALWEMWKFTFRALDC